MPLMFWHTLLELGMRKLSSSVKGFVAPTVFSTSRSSDSCSIPSHLAWFEKFFFALKSNSYKIIEIVFSLIKKEFRQINFLVIYLVKPLLSRNFCQKSVRENLRNFHTVVILQKFRQINILQKKFTINWFDGKEFAWQIVSQFSTLWWGNYRNLLSRFFGKNVVIATHLQN